ncbi:hypothetical protein KC866_01205 [Patescibacteria group bacterium]|nr:hypothetical protein [Patescibacteria group bacterium]
MINNIRNFIAIFFFIGFAFIAPTTFAQGGFDTGGGVTVGGGVVILGEAVTVDTADIIGEAMLSGEVQTNNAGFEIIFCLDIGQTTIEHCFPSIEWVIGNSYDINLQSAGFNVNPPVITDSTNQYNHLSVYRLDIATNERTILETHPLSELLGNGNTDPVSELMVDFRGWETADFVPVNENGISGYYPKLKSNGDLTRASSADLFLILKNLDTNTITVLDTYAASETNTFPISWPNPCDHQRPNCGLPSESNLIPGNRYAVYLSDTADGALLVNPGNSTSTYASLGLVPPPTDIITITNIIKVDNDYFQITGSFNGSEATEFVFRMRKETDSPGNELLIGNPLLEPGAYTYPTEPPSVSLNLENVDYVVEAVYNNNVVAARTINADGSTTPIIVTDPTRPSTSNNTVSGDVLENGIVPNDCGYNLGRKGNGRICGFADIIDLIGRIIEYIFILVIPIAALVFAYAGFLYLTSGGDTGKRQAAKRAMTNVIVGIIIVMAAWLVVRTIVVSIGVDPGASWFFLKNRT